MKEHRIVGLFVATIMLLCVAGVSQAQRATPCNAVTPNNAICIHWSAVTTYKDGVAIPDSVPVS